MMNRHYFSLFLIICLILIILYIFKKNYPRNYKKTGIEHFKEISVDEDKLDNLVELKLRETLPTIQMPPGRIGPRGMKGDAGAEYSNRGRLSSQLFAPKGVNSTSAYLTATKPIGNNGVPNGVAAGALALFAEPSVNSNTNWIHNKDGTLINQYLGDKYCLAWDKSSTLGENNVLQIVDKTSNECTRFIYDNLSRFAVNGATNQCVTVKHKSELPIEIQVPSGEKCETEKLSSGGCALSPDSSFLGIDNCYGNNSDGAEKIPQTFFFF